jgi:hypothetical protein
LALRIPVVRDAKIKDFASARKRQEIESPGDAKHRYVWDTLSMVDFIGCGSQADVPLSFPITTFASG